MNVMIGAIEICLYKYDSKFEFCFRIMPRYIKNNQLSLTNTYYQVCPKNNYLYIKENKQWLSNNNEIFPNYTFFP